MSQGPRPRNRSRSRLLTLALLPACAGLLALSLAPATIGQASPSVSVTSSSTGSTLAVIATVGITGNVLTVGAGPGPGDAIYASTTSNRLFRINPVNFTVDDSVAVDPYPIGIAVSPDDTVYVVNANSPRRLSVVVGGSLTVTETISVPNAPQSVALSRAVDDTIFISSRSFGGSSRNQITTLDARTLDDSKSYDVGATSSNSVPFGLAISRTDVAYISTYSADRVFLFTPSTSPPAVSNSAAITRPIGVAISDDDTIYVASETQNTLSAYPAADPNAITTVAVGVQPQGVTIGSEGTVFVANRNSNTVSAINPLTLTQDETVSVGSSPHGIVRTGDGLIAVGNRNSFNISIITSLTPSLGSASGREGSTSTLTLGGLPTGVLVDDSTVGAISFDGVAVSDWSRVAGTNTWSGPVPDGTGSVPITVALQGGNTADLGTFTYTVDPPPVIPAGPPTAVMGVAGDASASVSWAAPASTGSFPVTNYQVMSSPSGASCVTTVLTCEVTGLTNGTDYTFTVRALTGAGWSSWSTPSAVVTPQRPVAPSIMSTGSRGEVRGSPGIIVNGTSTGMGMGAVLTPWMRFNNQSSFTEGRARILVDESGEFTWQRRTHKTIHVQMRTPDGSMMSNTITISRR